MTDNTTPRAEWAISKVARLSKRFTVDLTIGPGGFVCEWAPREPRRGELTGKEIRRYRRARDACVTEVAERIGGNVLLVEL
jgi:hypothetical protein